VLAPFTAFIVYSMLVFVGCSVCVVGAALITSGVVASHAGIRLHMVHSFHNA